MRRKSRIGVALTIGVSAGLVAAAQMGPINEGTSRDEVVDRMLALPGPTATA